MSHWVVRKRYHVWTLNTAGRKRPALTYQTLANACQQAEYWGTWEIENDMPNPGKRVVDTIQALTLDIEKHADELSAKMTKESERTKDGFYKIETVVHKPWADANTQLEDYINQLTNGGPPLDD